MNLGTAHVLRANARHLPLPDDSVDLICTSPPYFSLRSYTDGGVHYQGQIGDEPTPAEFVDSLIEVTRECMRVLRPTGSLFVNLGDKYATGPPVGTSIATGMVTGKTPEQIEAMKRLRPNVDTTAFAPRKSLIGIPWRYALRCIDDLGLILRAEIIWSKPNGLPESVTDRVRRSHEQWFHFTLSPRYYSAVDEIREVSAPPSSTALRGPTVGFKSNGDRGDLGAGNFMPSPLGKLPGSVWTVPTEPLTVPDHLGVDHFAAFPSEWPKRIITGWSPAGVCTACGEGRLPTSVADRSPYGGQQNKVYGAGNHGTSSTTLRSTPEVTITGYACACPDTSAPTTPGVVLDCFGGTGTTAMVAKALGRTGITVDMSHDYSRLSQWRTTDRNQLAKVLGVEKAPTPDSDQLDLFGEIA